MTESVFDFDAIRRRRNAITGNGPSGTVWAMHDESMDRTVISTNIYGPSRKAMWLVETGHDWRYTVCRDLKFCTRCGWEFSRTDEQDAMWTPPQVCAGKLQWGEACIECGQKTVATFEAVTGTATRCLNPKCSTERWRRAGERDKDRLLTRLEANLEATKIACNLKPSRQAEIAWTTADNLLRRHRGEPMEGVQWRATEGGEARLKRETNALIREQQAAYERAVDEARQNHIRAAARAMLDSALLANPGGLSHLLKGKPEQVPDQKSTQIKLPMSPIDRPMVIFQNPDPLRRAEVELEFTRRELEIVEADNSWRGKGTGAAKLAWERLTYVRDAVASAQDAVAKIKRERLLAEQVKMDKADWTNALSVFQPAYEDFKSGVGSEGFVAAGMIVGTDCP